MHGILPVCQAKSCWSCVADGLDKGIDNGGVGGGGGGGAMKCKTQ